MSASSDFSDALLDSEDWRFDLVLTDPDTGIPLDLTGSRLRITFRALAGGTEIGTCSSDGDSPAITITDAAAGKASVAFLAPARTWRAPWAAYAPPATAKVIGDILRRPSADDTAAREGVGTIQIKVRPGTTSWP